MNAVVKKVTSQVTTPDCNMLVLHEDRLHEAKRGLHVLALLANLMQQAHGHCLVGGDAPEVSLRYDDLSATLELVREQMDVLPDATPLVQWRGLKAV